MALYQEQKEIVEKVKKISAPLAAYVELQFHRGLSKTDIWALLDKTRNTVLDANKEIKL
jgi:hypothetical protein